MTTENTENTERATPETDAEVMTFTSISKLKRRFECSTGKVSADFARRLERERDEAREKLARIESLLLDPHAVFFNFLHGKIAKLDWAKLEHIHGPHPARVECDEAREAMQYIAHSGLSARFLEDFAREFLKKQEGWK